MSEKKLKLTHPGKILLRGIRDLSLTPYRVAKESGISPSTMSAIVNGERPIMPETALRFCTYLRLDPQFFLNLQAHYDLELTKDRLEEQLKSITQSNNETLESMEETENPNLKTILC